jgi:hypothetical protein
MRIDVNRLQFITWIEITDIDSPPKADIIRRPLAIQATSAEMAKVALCSVPFDCRERDNIALCGLRVLRGRLPCIGDPRMGLAGDGLTELQSRTPNRPRTAWIVTIN